MHCSMRVLRSGDHLRDSSGLYGWSEDQIPLLTWANWSKGHDVTCTRNWRDSEGVAVIPPPPPWLPDREPVVARSSPQLRRGPKVLVRAVGPRDGDMRPPRLGSTEGSCLTWSAGSSGERCSSRGPNRRRGEPYSLALLAPLSRTLLDSGFQQLDHLSDASRPHIGRRFVASIHLRYAFR